MFPLVEVATAANTVLGQTEKLQYSKPLESLKKQIVDLMQKRGVICTENNIILTSGSQQGIYLLGKLFIQNNDTIFLEKILYPNVVLAFKSYSPKIVSISTSLKCGINVEEIEQALFKGIKPSLIYIISDGHNPMGVSISERNRKKLAEMALNYNFPIIEDDAYGFISYQNELNKPVKHYCGENVFYLGSFSKMLMPALRLGWIVVPNQYVETIEIMKESLDLNVSNLSQHIVSALLNQYCFDNHLKNINKIYKQKRDLVIKLLREYLPSVVSYSEPTHGFFIWVNFKDSVHTKGLLELSLRKYGVSFIVGNDFLVDGSLPGNNAIRLSFASCTLDEIKLGIRAIGESVKELHGECNEFYS